MHCCSRGGAKRPPRLHCASEARPESSERHYRGKSSRSTEWEKSSPRFGGCEIRGVVHVENAADRGHSILVIAALRQHPFRKRRCSHQSRILRVALALASNSSEIFLDKSQLLTFTIISLPPP